MKNIASRILELTMPTEKEKEIGGVPLSKWKLAFGMAIQTSIDKDYFTDVLAYVLYPGLFDKDIWFDEWGYVDEAFKEVFGISREECPYG